eukprot:scaffold120567_cov14-Prasinocladus_malaysianus.AAC.1
MWNGIVYAGLRLKCAGGGATSTTLNATLLLRIGSGRRDVPSLQSTAKHLCGHIFLIWCPVGSAMKKAKLELQKHIILLVDVLRI